jgi:hypothetical protein
MKKEDYERIVAQKFGYNDAVKDFFMVKWRSELNISSYGKGPIQLGGTFNKMFGIEYSKDFFQHFERQISGTGKEINKIYSIESSSRLALLCFQGISSEANQSLSLQIEGVNYHFTKCYFEVKNKVITLPSNIDIFLYDEKQKTLLYLESKFTEYIRDAVTPKDYFTIGKTYASKYPLLIQSLNKFIKKENEDSYEITVNEMIKHQYKEGVKQMISHYIGVRQGTDKRDMDYNEINKLWEEADKIYLGTILYEFKGSDFFTDYSQIYNSLAKVLNQVEKLSNDDYKNLKKVKVLENVLTYQEVFSKNAHLLTKETKEFYSLG